MNKQFCYLHGKIINCSETALSLNDRGFLFGDGIFETMRIYNGKPFCLDEHLYRLYSSAAFLGFALPEEEVIFRAAGELVKVNEIYNGSMRISVTGGEKDTALWPRSATAKPTIHITTSKTIPYQEELYEKGYRAVTVSFPRNELSPLVGIKSLNYLENILGRKEAAEAHCQEGLFLNTKSELTEGTISNLFMFVGNTLLTPPLNSGILPGITRKTVITLAKEELKISVKETALYPEDFARCEEAFLTASIMEIMPLVAVDGKNIGEGLPGERTRTLLFRYRILASSHAI